jgi:protein-L-isoaspartate(D-aspartate) O-methyltransferase
MVDAHLARRGIADSKVLDAFRSVLREAFVPSELAEFAYEDTPLPIGEGQTISQPYIVALTIQELGLRGGERVLEVGTGSGYAAAVLSRIASEVYTIERVASLAESAKERLARLGFANVDVHGGDGSVGWPQGAPYDAIVVAAAGPRIPDALREQLAVGGRLVMPVGDAHRTQRLIRVVRDGTDHFRETDLGGVVFVPLVGAQGWRPDPNGR